MQPIPFTPTRPTITDLSRADLRRAHPTIWEALFLPLLHTLVEERVGERRIRVRGKEVPLSLSLSPLRGARGRSSIAFKRPCQKLRCAPLHGVRDKILLVRN